MATGQSPFRGTDTISTLMAVAMENPRPPHEPNPAVPRPLSDLIVRLLGKNPRDRPASAREVVQAIGAIEAGPGGSPTQAVVSRSLLMVAVGLLAVVLLGVACGVYVALRNSSGATRGDGAEPDTQPPSAVTQKPLPPVPPDLAALQAVFDDEFADPAQSVLNDRGKPWPTKKDPWVGEKVGAELFFHDHRYVMRLLPREWPATLVHRFQLRERSANFACLLRCRFRGKGDVGWGFLHDGGGKVVVAVNVRLDGAVEVTDIDQDPAGLLTPKYGKFPPPVAAAVGEDTTLLVTLRARTLTIFVNGRPVGDPIRLERGFGPGTQAVAVWRRGGGECQAEFARFARWDLPQPAPPGGK
jgi:hypothetical protein